MKPKFAIGDEDYKTYADAVMTKLRREADE